MTEQDKYVDCLIKEYSEKLGLEIDPSNKNQRVNLAIKVADMPTGVSTWYAMEIATGRRIATSEEAYTDMAMYYQMRKFSGDITEEEKVEFFAGLNP